ncbi:MAG: DUF4982 domain-containing protein [Lachnospiraceae bacterium]|nr:DUF4982 domain-containing protein [Lachnospiraceae bacterium]
MRTTWNTGWEFTLFPADTFDQEQEDKIVREDITPGSERDRKLQNAAWQPVEIPHDWLIGNDPEQFYESGFGWYRKRFTWKKKDKKTRVFLTFDGVYMDSGYYCNGTCVGEWKYGYSPCTIEVTDALQDGENELLVWVRFRSPNSRWYSGAGIYRKVIYRETGETFIPENGVYVSTKKQGEDYLLTVDTEVAGVQADQAEVEVLLFEGAGNAEERNGVTTTAVSMTLQNVREEEGEYPFIQGDGVTAEAFEKTGSTGKAVRHLIREYLVKAPRQWDVEDPCLYDLRVRLVLPDGSKRSGDSQGENCEAGEEERIHVGFREVTLSPEQGFFLNGRKLKLNGVCEHHDLGALGSAFHKAGMRRKILILKEMGVNAIRLTHNMADSGVLELADDMGILLISESFDMWERAKTDYDYARFFPAWHGRDVEAWVCRDRNHPSVVFWSIGNEIYDTHADDHGQEITRDLMETVKKHDPRGNATPTIGSNYMPWEGAQKCADILKIAGYNYAEKFYEKHHKEHPDWVIYGSETFSIVQSRGIYHFPLHCGIMSDEDEQCSALGNSNTSWGADSYEECATGDRDMEFSMGQFLWSGFDYIGEPTPYHTKNSYFGQIDTAGFPKDVYHVWRSVWTDPAEKPMVHIFPYWDFNPGQMVDVRVCSNEDEVELFLNGKSLGKQTLTHAPGSGAHIIADYRIPYEEGTLTAVAYDKTGKETARCEKKSFGDSAKLVIAVEDTRPCKGVFGYLEENAKVPADPEEYIFAEISAVDAAGNPVENAADRVRVTVEGPAVLVGLDNGDSTDFERYPQSDKRLFSGKLLAVLRPTGEEGTIRVTASTPEAAGVESTAFELHAVNARNEEQTEVVSLVHSTKKADTEIPIRRITLTTEGERVLTKEAPEIRVKAETRPEKADTGKLTFRITNEAGIESHIAEIISVDGNVLTVRGKGDGVFKIRAMAGDEETGKIRVISELEFTCEGLGQAYLNPYELIAGGLYSAAEGEVGNGNERGVSTAREARTVVTFDNIDFGEIGSDEITIPIFSLDSDDVPVQVWEGIPGKEGASLLVDDLYTQKRVWNVYIPQTFKCSRFVKGITSISFVFDRKVHLKGFLFKKYEKAWIVNTAASADNVYGDTFTKGERSVTGIGNNVTLVFKDFGFGESGAEGVVIKGSTPLAGNTIHLVLKDKNEERKEILEFAGEDGKTKKQTFRFDRKVCGRYDVMFVFLPGSNFDFEEFSFIPSDQGV